MTREKLNIEALLLLINKSQLRYLGHVLRMLEGQIHKSEGHYTRGKTCNRPPQTQVGETTAETVQGGAGPNMDGLR